MKILFIYPEGENLGIEYLAAILKKEGHEVSLIFDPLLFQTYYLRINSLARCFSFKEKVVKQMQFFCPDLVCFSVFSDYYGWACEIAERIKEETNIPILFGGIHASLVPDIVIRESFVDYLCIGEGEEAILELLNALRSKKEPVNIKNIWFKKEGKIVESELRPLIPDLDVLPFPSKELFFKEYPPFVNKVYTLISGRGCPNACSYCYNSFFKKLYSDKGPYLRRRSVDNVISELRQAKEKYQIKRVSFFDDLFIYDLNWLEAFSERYKKEISLPFFCHVHPVNVNKKTVKLLKDAGCAVVTMGIQTTNEEIRKNILQRRGSNEEIIKAIVLIKESDIFLYTNIILGLPAQDEKDMIETVMFCNKYAADVTTTSWLRYYPKAEIIRIAKEQGFLDEEEIKSIEESKQYQPYSLAGSTYDSSEASLRNLITLSHFFSDKSLAWILKHRRYRYFLRFNMRFLLPLIFGLYQRVFLGKKMPFTYFSVWDMIKFYATYCFRFFKRVKSGEEK